MTNIKLTDLNVIVGTDLLSDVESFMQDLSEDGFDIQGGMKNIQMTIRNTTYKFTTPVPLPKPPVRYLE
jgi:hypothetical protein